MPEHAKQPVIESFVLGPFATNCHVVRNLDASACWIVDAGFDPGPMIARVRELRLTPEAVVLTHAHADHIAGLGQMKAAFPTMSILIHQAERDWLNDPALNLSAGFGEAITAPQADRLLTGGQTLDLAGSAWKVLHTPGHSPGGITLYCQEAGVAFVGDTLFAGSIGRFDFPNSDGETLFGSIRQTLYALPDGTIVYPGHGATTTIGREKATNPYVRA